MRGEDIQQDELFSYGTLEERVPADHPLRPIRAMVDEALQSLDGRFEEIYGDDGRKSIPPERLLRALLLQMLYTVRSERLLMEQLAYKPAVPLVCGAIGERASLAPDGIHQEPGPAAGRGGSGRVLLYHRQPGATEAAIER